MAGKEDNRIFVGGLGWDVTERQLEHAFDRYGKILECQVPISPPKFSLNFSEDYAKFFKN
jgi:RNA recognition motif-containing protein